MQSSIESAFSYVLPSLPYAEDALDFAISAHAIGFHHLQLLDVLSQADGITD